jgi:hypothetical protein
MGHIINCIVITCIVAMLWLLTNSMQDRGSDMLG